MPYFHFSFITRLFCNAVIAMAILPASSQAAEWRECEKAKLRELKLQHDSGKTVRKTKKKRQASRSERIEEIDTWLWKNCREFSYELRQLEQDRM